MSKKDAKGATNWGAMGIALTGSGAISSITARMSVNIKTRGQDAVVVIASRRRGRLDAAGAQVLSDWGAYSVSVEGESLSEKAQARLSATHSPLLAAWLVSDEAESTLRRTLAQAIRAWAVAKIGGVWHDDMRYDDVVVSAPVGPFGSFGDLLDADTVADFAQELTELDTMPVVSAPAPVEYAADGRLFSLDLVAA